MEIFENRMNDEADTKGKEPFGGAEERVNETAAEKQFPTEEEFDSVLHDLAHHWLAMMNKSAAEIARLRKENARLSLEVLDAYRDANALRKQLEKKDQEIADLENRLATERDLDPADQMTDESKIKDFLSMFDAVFGPDNDTDEMADETKERRSPKDFHSMFDAILSRYPDEDID